MHRLQIEPRVGWQGKVEEQGLVYHTPEVPYWDESVCYRFNAAQIDQVEAATNELHRLCLRAVDRVVREDLFARLAIPERWVPLIRRSWERKEQSIFGRFDLWWDGCNPPKLLEYNADTPTSLLEAAVVQWFWLEEMFPEEDQFNSLHERLIARWQGAEVRGTVYFTCLREAEEDLANVTYLADTARQAGLATEHIFIEDIGWNAGRKLFLDQRVRPIETLMKLYPWEWMLEEEFGPHLAGAPWRVFEPAWKLVLSNKGILPILWEMAPGHPNLLPAYAEPQRLGESYVKKPLFGREGANITLVRGSHTETTPGEYGAEGFVYQAFQPLPNFDGHCPVIGSWVIGNEAGGMGIRESESLITGNTSRFVPHYFTG